MATIPAGRNVLGPIDVPRQRQRLGLNLQAADWPLVDTGVCATVALELLLGGEWRQVLALTYTGGRNSRTGARAPGPHPIYDAGQPLPNGTRARWIVTLAQAMTCDWVME